MSCCWCMDNFFIYSYDWLHGPLWRSSWDSFSLAHEKNAFLCVRQRREINLQIYRLSYSILPRDDCWLLAGWLAADSLLCSAQPGCLRPVLSFPITYGYTYSGLQCQRSLTLNGKFRKLHVILKSGKRNFIDPGYAIHFVFLFLRLFWLSFFPALYWSHRSKTSVNRLDLSAPHNNVSW